jgi:hypothetical protein
MRRERLSFPLEGGADAGARSWANPIVRCSADGPDPDVRVVAKAIACAEGIAAWKALVRPRGVPPLLARGSEGATSPLGRLLVLSPSAPRTLTSGAGLGR